MTYKNNQVRDGWPERRQASPSITSEPTGSPDGERYGSTDAAAGSSLGGAERF